MTAIHHRSIARLAADMGAGAVSPSDVVRHHLDRIAVLDGVLRAFIQVDRDGALAAAAESDRRLRDGAPRRLEGVPVAIKANIAVRGLAWSAGMALRRDVIAGEDAPVVARLRSAGAVILGTLNMHEAALGATTDNVWFGRCINPHGEGRTPGGSSGGSGAAVAAGLCAAALGTDTLGSVRIPAAYNGVYGLKPGEGVLSDAGLVPLAPRLDAIGPLARSLDDLEQVWGVLADAGPAPKLDRLVPLDALGDVECEDAVLDGYDRAREALPLPVGEPLRLPPLTRVRTAGFIDSAHALSRHLGSDRTERADLLSPELRWLLDYADKAEADPALLAEVRATLRAAIGASGVLLLPTTPHAAFAQGRRAPASQADFTGLANIAGLPALALPSGRDADGMPVGVQLVGPPGSETALIDLARGLDRALSAYAPPPLF